MMHALLTALGLVFILEGIMPFLFPRVWRQMILRIMMQTDKSLRIFGLASMLLGLGILYLFY